MVIVRADRGAEVAAVVLTVEDEVEGMGGGGGVVDSETVTVTGAVVVVVNPVNDASLRSLLAAATISFSRTSLASFLAANEAAADLLGAVDFVEEGSSLTSRRVETAFINKSSPLAGVASDEVGGREEAAEEDDDEAGLARAARRRSEVGAVDDGGVGGGAACEGGGDLFALSS